MAPAVALAPLAAAPKEAARERPRASKTWVVPPKLKPGRKRKIDEKSAVATPEPIESEVQELQAKVQQLEQTKDDKAAFYQNLAKKLHEENEALKVENARLRKNQSKRSTAKIRRTDELSPSTVGSRRNSDASMDDSRSVSSETSGFQEAYTPAGLSFDTSFTPFESTFESCGMCTASSNCLCHDMGLPPPILPGPVASPQSVAIKLPKKGITKGSMWALNIPAEEKVCNGDPKTCKACADDPVGQAWCQAVSTSMCAVNPCSNCPKRPSPLRNSITVSTSTNSSEISSIRRKASQSPDTLTAPMTSRDAWLQIRDHPNIGNANMDLLASVVASHGAKCSTVDSRDIEDSGGCDREKRKIEIGKEGIAAAVALLDAATRPT